MKVANFSMKIAKASRKKSLRSMKRSRLSIRGIPSNQEFGRKCSEEGELLSNRHEKKWFVIRGIDKLLLEEASGKRTS